MPDLSERIRSQIEADDADAWKPEHDDAMRCRDLEAFIRVGMREFRKIRDQDDAWSRMVQSHRADFQAEVAKHFRSRYEWWFEPCDCVLACIQQAEKDYVVDGADEFRRARVLVKDILATPIEEAISAMERIAKGDFERL